MRMPEDFLLKISKLGDKTEEIIPKVLESERGCLNEVGLILNLNWKKYKDGAVYW